jgi:uncharacterized coiled-coil DUF342 family protein
MKQRLQYLNLVGVLALAGLCAAQWQNNRKANLEVMALEKARQEQSAKIEEQEKALKGYKMDLDSFREQLVQSHGLSKEAETKATAAERKIAQLSDERDQLRASVTNWVGAVHLRDDRLKEANEQLQKMSGERNETVTKYNELVQKYNGVVKDLNDARARLMASKPAEQNSSSGK